MKIVTCSQCGKKFQAYTEESQNGYSDCKTHMREFFTRNPQFISKQIDDVSKYLTADELAGITRRGAA